MTAVPDALPKRVRLSTLTTLGVGGEAELWVAETTGELAAATRAPYRVLGAGSNLLVADAGVGERVIKLGRAYNDVRGFGAGHGSAHDVWLGAATPLPGLVRRAAEVGWSGLEGLLGVPAVLGGAVAMNAGTRFGEMSDTLREVEVFVAGGLERLPADALGLSYRHSSLPPGAVLTRVRLRLTPSSPERVRAQLARVDAARQGQPKSKSAGCAFKNPPGDSAGRLIDAAGLKGLRVGQAVVSPEHGNFIVNIGGATAADIVRLLELIRARVGTPLRAEWELWGFGPGTLKEVTCAALSS
ncbi:MAG: UDP-N-acetylenolpyruvoylglucosamine reductase [uncultured Truepera sp.]|uniref:UDP-N-acetylenolpyruvoylglucosamine reductase n=1 Tax=uncultured Truepera sp. TaxID=543023 RepID=A0A6J4VYB4_9DEIN|nr:MAG: UDP-N-acetylenolpyruvoylglucosamine reductase [uncultured Truepera sp.]